MVKTLACEVERFDLHPYPYPVRLYIFSISAKKLVFIYSFLSRFQPYKGQEGTMKGSDDIMDERYRNMEFFYGIRDIVAIKFILA